MLQNNVSLQNEVIRFMRPHQEVSVVLRRRATDEVLGEARTVLNYKSVSFGCAEDVKCLTAWWCSELNISESFRSNVFLGLKFSFYD